MDNIQLDGTESHPAPQNDTVEIAKETMVERRQRGNSDASMGGSRGVIPLGEVSEETIANNRRRESAMMQFLNMTRNVGK